MVSPYLTLPNIKTARKRFGGDPVETLFIGVWTLYYRADVILWRDVVIDWLLSDVLFLLYIKTTTFMDLVFTIFIHCHYRIFSMGLVFLNEPIWQIYSFPN